MFWLHEVQHEIEGLVGSVADVRAPVPTVGAQRGGYQVHEASVGRQVDDEHELCLDQVSCLLRHLAKKKEGVSSRQRRLEQWDYCHYIVGYIGR